jgi:hypothetical protein
MYINLDLISVITEWRRMKVKQTTKNVCWGLEVWLNW